MLSLVLLTSFNMYSQEKDEKGTFTLSGSVDTYYSTNLSTSDIGTIGTLTDVPANGLV